jgi:hypothetical protein
MQNLGTVLELEHLSPLKVIHLVHYKIRISKLVVLQSLLKHVDPQYWGT